MIRRLSLPSCVCVFTSSSTTMPCKCFTGLINSTDYRFATVDTTNDLEVLKTLGLVRQKLVHIHNHYKVWGSKKDKHSHVDLAMPIIDPYYTDMKAK
ncbi:Serine/threonine-protein kinase [Hordeum vulgare]|nr:Serine/threonine-protein kinase [Hordeum vulgare]